MLSLENQILIHLQASFHPVIGQKDKVSFKSQNQKKVSSLSKKFLMISNKMSNFELHPHIPEIRIYVLKYEQAILNVEFFDL